MDCLVKVSEATVRLNWRRAPLRFFGEERKRNVPRREGTTPQSAVEAAGETPGFVGE